MTGRVAWSCVGLSLAGLLASPWQGARAFEESTETRHYDVSGDTPAQIWSEMRARGPTGSDGGRNNARTQWQVRWRFPFERTAAGCATGPVTVTLTVTFILPRWERPPGASSTVKSQWTRYIEALEEHEDGHADFGRRAARRIETKLEAIAPRDTCEALERDANRLGRQILDDIRPEEREYDRETNHGATQGTAFFRELAGH